MDASGIQRIIETCFEGLYSNQVQNLEEIDTFLNIRSAQIEQKMLLKSLQQLGNNQ